VFQIILEVSHVSVFLPIRANDVKTVSRKRKRKLFIVVDYTVFVLANPCASNPCGSNGQCIQSGGGFYCECNLGYFGNQCERKLKICNPSYGM
jgi:hypothetical protein